MPQTTRGLPADYAADYPRTMPQTMPQTTRGLPRRLCRGSAPPPSKPKAVQSKPDTFLRQSPQKLQTFFAIRDRHPSQANLIVDELFEPGLFLCRELSWSPSGRIVLTVIIWIPSVGYDGINGPDPSSPAVFFSASLADVASSGTSFRLSDNPTPLEDTQSSKRLNHFLLRRMVNETSKGLSPA
jgi:hypothetical protein